MAANNDLSFLLVTSCKGTNKLYQNGNLYILPGIIKKEWKCNIREGKARVHLTDDLFVKRFGEHSHTKENGTEELAIF